MDQDCRFLCVTKDGSSPDGLPAVFFTCHPGDFSWYFDRVCDLLFSKTDCAVYYTEDQNADLSSEEDFLKGMMMFVIPLSARLFDLGARALDHDLPFANENEIRVLPLVMEDELEQLYRISDYIGDIKYLNINRELTDGIIDMYLYDSSDPGILQQFHVLAETYFMREKYKEAAEIWEWTLENRIKVLGEDHPQTLETMTRLVKTYSELGRDTDSALMRAKVLQQLLGKIPEKDPAVLTEMNNIAVSLDDKGEHEKALEIKKKVLEGRIRVLGEDNRDTVIAMSNLAYSYGLKEDYQEKLRLEEQAYEIARRVLGDDDPSTVTTLSNIGYTREKLGEWDKAAAAYAKVLDSRRRILGQYHEKTLKTAWDLAVSLRNAGRYADSAEAYTEVRDICVRIYGEDDVNTKYAGDMIRYMETKLREEVLRRRED